MHGGLLSGFILTLFGDHLLVFKTQSCAGKMLKPRVYWHGLLGARLEFMMSIWNLLIRQETDEELDSHLILTSSCREVMVRIAILTSS